MEDLTSEAIADGRPGRPQTRRRLAAGAALVFGVIGVIALAAGAIRSFPEGLTITVAVIIAAVLVVDGLRRRGPSRTVEVGIGAAVIVGTALLGTVWRVGEAVLVGAVAFFIAGAFARIAFAAHGRLAAVPAPSRPVVFWNPRSGGGKAAKADLANEARRRGIEAIELRPGDDLEDLVNQAIADGADALAAAGGDGTQAIVAKLASRAGLPFACIPAGTRNHFALDLGVDRDDVVGALDALVDGGERVVDLAEVNGIVFVNNASLGIYAAAVQRGSYRDAKVATLIDTVPDAFGHRSDAAAELRWSGPDGGVGSGAAVLLVSNNAYRLGTLVGSGTRPRLDTGLLGIASVGTHIRRWTTSEFVVDSDSPVPIGIDGESMVLDPPLRFTSLPGALRVRIAPAHRGASPSADAPLSIPGSLVALARIVSGRPGVP